MYFCKSLAVSQFTSVDLKRREEGGGKGGREGASSQALTLTMLWNGTAATTILRNYSVKIHNEKIMC